MSIVFQQRFWTAVAAVFERWEAAIYHNDSGRKSIVDPNELEEDTRTVVTVCGGSEVAVASGL